MVFCSEKYTHTTPTIEKLKTVDEKNNFSTIRLVVDTWMGFQESLHKLMVAKFRAGLAVKVMDDVH